MAFCAKCGTSLQAGASFCGSCGTPVGATAGSSVPSPGLSGATGPSPATGSAPLASNVAGLLTYVPLVGWIIAIVFIVVEPYKNDKFVRFHAFQALFFGIACFVLSFVLGIVTRVLWVVPVIGWIIDMLLWPFFWLGVLAVGLFLMFKAYNNEKFRLPVIGDIAAQQAG